MTRDQFTAFLRNPETIASYATDELQQLVNNFPYCQPLRALQLKQLKENDSIQYSQRLKVTAAYSPDRVKLYQLMNRPSKEVAPSSIGISAFPDLVENTIQEEEKLIQTTIEESNVVQETPEITPVDLIHESLINPKENSADSLQEQEKIHEEIKETSPQEIIVNRLKEMNLWEENKEEGEKEEATSESDIASESTIENSAIENPFEEPKSEIIEEEFKKDTEEITVISNQTEEENDHQTLVSGYLESITQSNEVIAPSSSTSLPIQEEEKAVLSFSDWLKRKDFPQESSKESPHEIKSHRKEENKEEATPPTAKILYIKEDLTPEISAHLGPIAEKINEPILDKVEEIKVEEISNTAEITAEKHPVRTLRTNEELGLKEVIRPIKKGRAAERKNKNKSEEKNQESKTEKAPEYQNKIIDRFIEEEPRITPIKATIYNPVNMARKSTIQPDDVVTETLAMIYAQQGNYEKAISFYEKLSLKFPEKSVYFASLIQELKNKQNQ